MEMQTAQQINAPQVGQVDLPQKPRPAAVPLPAKLIAEKQRLAQEAKAKPEGWWSISGEGSVAGVNTAVDNSDLPAHWKAAIKADIAARCVGELNFVYLDAHCHIEKGKQVVNYTLTADKKLL